MPVRAQCEDCRWYRCGECTRYTPVYDGLACHLFEHKKHESTSTNSPEVSIYSSKRAEQGLTQDAVQIHDDSKESSEWTVFGVPYNIFMGTVMWAYFSIWNIFGDPNSSFFRNCYYFAYCSLWCHVHNCL